MKLFSKAILKYRKFKSFLGKRVWFFLRMSVLIGFFWFFIESSFIFVLQAFLLAIGLVDQKNVFLPSMFPTGLVAAAVSLVAFGFFRAAALMARQYFSEMTNQAFLRIQRERLLEFSLARAGSISTHDIVNIFSERLPAASKILLSVSGLVNTVIASLCFFLLGLKLAPKELVLGSSILLILFFVLRSLSHTIQQLGVSMIQETKRLTGVLVIGLRNNFLLRIYDKTDQEIKSGRAAAEAYEHLYARYIFLATFKAAFPQFAGALVVGLICYASGVYFKTTGAKLVSFIYIFMRLAQALSEGAAVMMSIRFNWGSFKELYHWHLMGNAYFEEKSVEDDTPQGGPATDLRYIDKVELSVIGLEFGFGKGASLFSGLTFRVGTGDVLLIKGPSGSGKSTLLSLLLGLLKPRNGRVLINHYSAAHMRKVLAPHIGYVGPDAYLIQGTVRDNLRYLNDSSVLSDQDLWDALASARIDDVVRSNGQGLSRELLEHTELSTGQKQRLAIARALLRRPKILIMDEATANLDPGTEQEIIDVLRGLRKDMLLIVVSHKDAFDSMASQVVSVDRTGKAES